MSLIKERTLLEEAGVLEQYLPSNPLYHGDNLKKVLLGLAASWLDYRAFINKITVEYNIDTTEDLISSWEGFVGIPDSCFDIASTIEERRQNVLLKIAGLNVATARQFENIAQILGFSIQVTSGVEESSFPMTFPVTLLSASDLGFTILVKLNSSLKPSGFPLTFPFEFTGSGPNILECLFNKIKPANTQVIFKYIN
jgi:uncharacterized protein YmfQ (DUF2313 family)